MSFSHKYVQIRGGDRIKQVEQEEPAIPPKPIARRLDVKALRQTLDLVDKEELSKALAGQSVDSFIEGAVQLFNVSVADQQHDSKNYVALYKIDFSGFDYKHTMRWYVDNNMILLESPALVLLKFSVPSKAYYLIGIHAARYQGGDYKAKYRLQGIEESEPLIEGSLNMDGRPIGDLDLDPPLPVLAYIDDLSPYKFRFFGHNIFFRSISVWKF